MSAAWENLSTEDIWVKWPEGAALALFNEKGMLDSSNAIDYIA